MEIKEKLLFPYTQEQKIKFIVEYNHKKGYEITEETGTGNLLALGESELERIEREAKEEFARIRMLKLTRGDVFRGLLQARGITRTMIKSFIEEMPEDTDDLKMLKELAFIDFDEALDFYRGNVLIDTIGGKLGITQDQLTEFFETNDYKKLL